MGREAHETRPAGLLGPLQRFDGLFDLAFGVEAAVDLQADPPQVHVVQVGLLHPLLEARLELLRRPPLLEAAFPDVP